MTPRWWITALYVVATVLPLYGLGHALYRLAPRAFVYWKQERKMKGLKRRRDRLVARQAPANAIVEANQCIEAVAREARNIPGQVTIYGGASPNGASYSQFKALLNDLLFVGAGLIAGCVASIWSVWVGPE